MMVTYFNASVCFFIALRLFSFNRQGYKYRLSWGLMAWAMICSCLATAIFTCFGFAERAYISQVIMNSLFCLCTFNSKGNVASIFPSPKSLLKS